MLKNKVIVIAGGAGLLGKEFVKTIVMNGGICVIADLNEKAGEDAKSKLSGELKTKNIDFIKTDITNVDAIDKLIVYTNEKYKKIDALVNNAYPRNKNYGRSFFEVEYSDFCENVSLNLGGLFLTSRQFAKYFVARKKGNIINISSIYGAIAPRFEIYKGTAMTMPVEYAAVKSAVIHFTKYLAKFLKGTGVRSNCISPGGIFNDQPERFLKNYNAYSASKGMLDPKDIAGALFFLLSDSSEFVNGQNIIVDDGFSL